MLEAGAAVLTLSMLIPLVPFLCATKAVAAAGIPLVVSKDMMQPPPRTTLAPHRVLTATNNHCLPAPGLNNCVTGEHCAGRVPRDNCKVAASGAAFITPAALNPILYSMAFGLAAALPQT